MFQILLVLVGCQFGGRDLLKRGLRSGFDDPGYGFSSLTGMAQGGVTGGQIEMNASRVQQPQTFQRGHGLLADDYVGPRERDHELEHEHGHH